MVANKRKQPLDYSLSTNYSQAESFDHHTDFMGSQLSISYNSLAPNLTVLPTQVTITFFLTLLLVFISNPPANSSSLFTWEFPVINPDELVWYIRNTFGLCPWFMGQSSQHLGNFLSDRSVFCYLEGVPSEHI